MSYFMRQWKLIISIGFVIDLSLAVEGEAMSNRTAVPPKGKRKYSFPTPILHKNLEDEFEYQLMLGTSYIWGNHPIFAFGVPNFMSYAAHFCRYETKKGSNEVVSVGCGLGNIERGIIATYRDLFGEQLNITLVEPGGFCISKDFKTVKDLMEERAGIVRNCVLLIIFPNWDKFNDGYDIDAIRQLQPCSVLTLYEITGMSGSKDFRACLYSRDIDGARNYYTGKNRPRLNNYAIQEVAYREAHRPKNETYTIDGMEDTTYRYKMVNLKRKD